MATTTKASSGGSSSTSTAAVKGAQTRKAHEDPFGFVDEFRERAASAVDKLVNAGEPEAADFFRQLRKLIDVHAKEFVAERDKRIESEAIDRNVRDIREQAIKRARA